MKNGCPVPTLSHKDFDFFGSIGTPNALPPFPLEYDTDLGGFGTPDQNAEGRYFACTKYTQAAISTDLTGIKRNSTDLDALYDTTNGGYDIRASLDAARSLGWLKWYFNIKAFGQHDYFDTFRYAQFIGLGDNEIRSITVGTPWFLSWEKSVLSGNPVLPMPTPDEITAFIANPSAFSWHNWEIVGWKQINGSPMLKGKSWQGSHDPVYVPREVINVIMSFKYTVAYTPTMLAVPQVVRVALPLLDYLKSIIRNLPLSWRY